MGLSFHLGRLAVSAMDIHAGYEDALAKGILTASHRDRSILAEFGKNDALCCRPTNHDN